jgi:ABC-2 type transport system ATP-binding protein
VSDVLLQASSVSRRYRRLTALAAIDVALHSGESLALVGPNGAGKSTLLSLLAGSLSPSSGEIGGASAAKVGWLPQRPSHYGRLTAGENLALFARLEGIENPGARARELLGEFGLPDDRQSARLSVGNRQRLSLAIALLAKPRVLLLDEPTASLDPHQRALLWQAIDRHLEAGGALCFADQNPEEVERHAHRILALDAGKLVFAGSPEEFARWERES